MGKTIYKKPTILEFEMSKDICGLVTGSNGDNEAWSKKPNYFSKDSFEEDNDANNGSIFNQYKIWEEE